MATGQPIRTAVLATVPSDSHTWNLVYLELVLSEAGFDVRNLGACTMIEDVISSLNSDDVDVLVVSSVNGHGGYEAQSLIETARAQGFSGAAVIGGKLGCGDSSDGGIARRLTEAGFDAVVGDDNGGSSPAVQLHERLCQILPWPDRQKVVSRGSA